MGVFNVLGSLASDSGLLTLFAWFIGLVSFASLASCVYSAYLHPLSKYPGPRIAGATRLWFCYHGIRGDLHVAIHRLHLKYGEVVRIAPDELSYTHADGWMQIYGQRPGKPEITKDPLFYRTLNAGPSSIVSASRDRHAVLRKQMSPGFSERAMREQEAIIRSYADSMIGALKRNGEAKVADLTRWYNYFTFDVMGHLVFGEPFDCLKCTGYHPWVSLIFDAIRSSSFLRSASFWPWLTPLIRKFIPKEMQRRRLDQQEMARAKVALRKSIKDAPYDLSASMLKPESGVTAQEYEATVQSIIIAGSETTATALSGVTFFLLNNPDKLERVVNEVRSAFASPEDISFVNINQLPYLLACLNEALRMYPPIPDAFPRNTTSNVEILLDQPVPPNTIVRMTHWATFHSPRNFARPDEYLPERWVGENPQFANDKKNAFQPFHVGPRNCIGRNLAYMEMRLAMALMLWHFDMELCEESKDWSNQKVYLLWQKPALMVKMSPRSV
ncbi:cytochrome P450 monooxygenase [Aspergillus taichungensis]|uniref:Cytochrome P450 monooxygenase n=1 Tax=Aspergillus taichungensis TaxID=482145 RepID=A0A2J5HRN3_9EURO|nr:cytochrome P450 monooxygenase [Aspergillus taichungensis]